VHIIPCVCWCVCWCGKVGSWAGCGQGGGMFCVLTCPQEVFTLIFLFLIILICWFGCWTGGPTTAMCVLVLFILKFMLLWHIEIPMVFVSHGCWLIQWTLCTSISIIIASMCNPSHTQINTNMRNRCNINVECIWNLSLKYSHATRPQNVTIMVNKCGIAFSCCFDVESAVYCLKSVNSKGRIQFWYHNIYVRHFLLM